MVGVTLPSVTLGSWVPGSLPVAWLMIVWCSYTLWSRGAHLPPWPRLSSLSYSGDALGWLRHRAGSHAAARELLEAAVNAAPDDPTARFHLASVYATAKQRGRAREELKAALDSARAFPEDLPCCAACSSRPSPTRVRVIV